MMLLADLYDRWFSSSTSAVQADGSLLIRSAPGRYVVWVAVFLLLSAGGGWCWRRRRLGHWGPTLFFASFVVPLLVIPGMAAEFVHVTPSSLEVSTGFWFAPRVFRFPFVDLESLTDEGRSWIFRYGSGEQRGLDLSDMLQANRDRVLDYLRNRGVRVNG